MPDDGLTPRQREVLRLAAEGLTIRATARKMNVAPCTAEAFRSAAFVRLGAGNITHAVAIALREGMIR